MKLGVGLKWAGIAAVVLAVILTFVYVIRYIQQVERDKIQIELQEETEERRKVIRDEVQRATPSDPSDASDSLRFLRDRQSESE